MMLDRMPAWTLAVVAMLSVQFGAALSIGLFEEVGVAGTAWLRLTFAGIALILIARPRYWTWTLAELRAPLLLGVVSAVMTLAFLGAIDRLPLGTVVAIEFLGPLTVAAIASGGGRALAWPILAFAGVVLLTEPWQGEVDVLGLGLAGVAAVCRGLYIVITQRVGDRFTGLTGLAVSVPVAAIITAVVGVPQAWGNLTWQVLAWAFAAAMLLPLLPWSLEMMALRRLTKAAFGTLMALEPAFAVVVGLILLSQQPGPLQVVGVACVVIAGVAAERRGTREHALPDLEQPMT